MISTGNGSDPYHGCVQEVSTQHSGHVQHRSECRAKAVPARRLVSHFLSAMKLVMAGTWERPITLLLMVAARPVKCCIPSVPHVKDCKSWVREAEQAKTCVHRVTGADFHLMELSQGLNPSQTHTKKPHNLPYSLHLLTSAQFRLLHCEEKNKHVRWTATVGLSTRASSSRDWFPSCFETCWCKV